QATYWEDFLYPEEGMGIVFEKMAAEIVRLGGEVWLDSRPSAFVFDGSRIASVKIDRAGGPAEVPVSAVVSTIPLPALGLLVRGKVPEDAYRASQALASRSLVLVNLIVRMPMVSEAHWVYLLDPRFRFNRFCEQKNLLLEKKPPLETMLTFEACCGYRDEFWNLPDSALVKLALEDIGRIERIDGSRVTETLVRRVKDAYPVYGVGFEGGLERFFIGAAGIDNLYPTGRQGLFLNTDMHDTMELGLLAVEAIADGVPGRDWYGRIVSWLPYAPPEEER
nr:hypothetical protein [bacterium]